MNRSEGQASSKGKFPMIVLAAIALIAITGFVVVRFVG